MRVQLHDGAGSGRLRRSGALAFAAIFKNAGKPPPRLDS
jgi:hypothetical protein